MKNFTFMLVAVTLFSAASFAQRLGIGNNKIPSNTVQTIPQKAILLRHQVDRQKPVIQINKSKSQSQKRVLNSLNPYTDEVITDQPAGKLFADQIRSGYSIYYGAYGFNYDALVANYVLAADSTIYLQNPISMLYNGTWLKLDKVDSVNYVAKLPQPVYDYYGTYLYAVPMKIDLDNSSWGLDSLADGTVKSEISFTYKDGVLKQTDEDYIALSDLDGNWYGYADNQSLLYAPSSLGLVQNTKPANLEAEDYVLKYHDTDSTTVQAIKEVAIDGNTFYLNNPYNDAEDEWIVGSLNGDKVTFKGVQYLGPDTLSSGYHLFYVPTTYAVVPYTDSDGNTSSSVNYTAVDSLTFTWNPDSKTLTADAGTSLLINASLSQIYYAGSYDDPTYNKFHEVAAVPADPAITYVYDYNANYGYGYFIFYIYPEDVDGNFINTKKLSYKIYVDDPDEPFVFYNDEYTEQIEDEKSEFAYDYTDNWDVYAAGDEHAIYYYFADWDSIGVQSIYDGAGVENKSHITWYVNDALTSIQGVQNSSDAVVKSETWYDLSGRRVNNPSNGFYIKKTVYADGKKKTVKLLK